MTMRFCSLLVLLITGSITPAGAQSSNDDFAIGEDQGLQSKPTLAYDSRRDRFLSVWGDLRNIKTNSVDIYGRIVDANGGLVTDEFPIITAPRGQSHPVASYDAENDRFLVVWTDWRHSDAVDSDIYGRWLGGDGTPQGDSFAIVMQRGVSQITPNLAYDPSRELFLVVWGDNSDGGKNYKIYGRLLDTKGNLLGEPFRLSRGGEGTEDGPSPAYDSKRKRFFVIWRDIRIDSYQQRGKTIYGSFVDPVQGMVGEQVWIAFEDDACLPPSLHASEFAPEQDVFLVTWTSAKNYDEPVTEEQIKGLDVYGVIIDAEDGRRRIEDIAIASEADYQEFSAVAFDQYHKRFLVVWYDLRRPPSGRSMDIYGRYIKMDGSMSDEFLISDPHLPGIRRFPNLVFSPQSQRFFIVWEDARVPGVNKRRVYGHIENGE